MKRTVGYITANYTNPAFGELTARRTLASLPFAGRYRFIDFILSNMVNSGISTVGLVTPHNSRSLLDHVGVGQPWNMGRKAGGLFVLPGSVSGMRLGAGKVLIRDLKNNGRFLDYGDADNILVCGSNMIYNMDYRPLIEAHEKSGAPVTFAYTKRNYTEARSGDFFEIEDTGRISGYKNQAQGDANLFMGCVVFDKEFLLNCIDWYGAYEYMSLLEMLIRNREEFRLNSYCFDGYVGVIENILDYKQVNMDVLDYRINQELFNPERPISTRVQDFPPTFYKDGSHVVNSFVAAGSLIEGTVENSIIFRGVKIGAGAIVKDCIIMAGTVIGENAALSNVICDKNVTIHNGVCLAGGADPLVIAKDSTF